MLFFYASDGTRANAAAFFSELQNEIPSAIFC